MFILCGIKHFFEIYIAYLTAYSSEIIKKNKEMHYAFPYSVESRGVEPLSKHRNHWLSTCLFHDYLSAPGRT